MAILSDEVGDNFQKFIPAEARHSCKNLFMPRHNLLKWWLQNLIYQHVRFSYEWFQSTRYPQTLTRNTDLLQHLGRTNKFVSVRSSTHPFSPCSALAQLPQPKYSLEQKQHLRMEFKLPSIMFKISGIAHCQVTRSSWSPICLSRLLPSL